MSRDATVEDPALRRFTERLLRWRHAVLLLCLALTALAGAFALARLRVDNTTEAFLVDDAEAAATLSEMRERFGADNLLQIVVDGDVFTPAFMERLDAFHAALEAVEIPLEDGRTVTFEDVHSLARVTRFELGLFGRPMVVRAWHPGADPSGWEAEATTDPELVGDLLAADGQHTVVVVRTGDVSERDAIAMTAALDPLIAAWDQPGFTLHVAGWPALARQLSVRMFEDLGRMVGLSMLALLVILGAMFRQPVGVLGPGLVVGQAVAITAAAMAAADIPLTAMTNVLPALLLCVGVGAAVHVQSVYRDLLADGVERDEAIVRAVAATGVPIFFTTATTCIGLLSFRTASLGTIRDIGTMGALGVAAAGLLSITFLPAFLTLHRGGDLGRRVKDGPDRIDAVLDRCLTTTGGRPRFATLVGSFLVFGFALVGVAQLRVAHEPVGWFPADDPAREAFEHIEATVGGTSVLVLLVDSGHPGGMTDPDLLAALSRLDDHVRGWRHPDDQRRVVDTSDSLLDPLRAVWAAGRRLPRPDGSLPGDAATTEALLSQLERARPDAMRRLVDAEHQRALMVYRVEWMDAWSYDPLAAHIRQGIDTLVGDRAQVRLTGTAMSFWSLLSGLLSDLLWSLGTATAVITAIMIALLRRPALGLLAMIPNLLPVFTVLGMMGHLGVPLDMGNLLVASIALGISVDDTIHFFHGFRMHHEAGKSTIGAIEASMRHAGRAMIGTSVILGIGFSVYQAAGMANIRLFGTLITVVVVLALVADLVLAPALLSAAYDDQDR